MPRRSSGTSSSCSLPDGGRQMKPGVPQHKGYIILLQPCRARGVDGGVLQVHHARPAAALVKKISQAAACQCACEKCRCLARVGLSRHRYVLEPGWNARVNRDSYTW